MVSQGWLCAEHRIYFRPTGTLLLTVPGISHRRPAADSIEQNTAKPLYRYHTMMALISSKNIIWGTFPYY